MFQDFFKCENCSSGGSKSIKSIFDVSRFLKEPPSVLKILFQRGNYDRTNYVDTENKLKFAIPSEYLCKQPSSNEKI